ncbi:MAG: hypothetical protein HY400_02415 [Elusimicrobia bacterium]|nr:hypothetical protein [Elusimicrobiota bacterium]
MKKVVLCKYDPEYCPSVEFLEGGNVRIGEDPTFVTLTKTQWNILVEKIEKKELTSIN